MLRRQGIGFALAWALAAAAFAQEPAPLEVMGFSGSSNWPLFVAQDKGFFARHGVQVRLSSAPNSVVQLTSLIEGKLDIAMTAIDNVIAYQEGQGEVEVKTKPDLMAFLGVNNGGRFNLMVLPEVRRHADLRGRELAVDALTTGYAFVLMEMLRKGGLQPGEYKLVSAGGSRTRYEGLREKKFAGTLLNSPYDLISEAAGFNRLASSGEVIGRYQGSVGAARRGWAAANEARLVGYIRGYVAAVDWLYDPANKAEAVAILAKRLERLKPDEAERTYEELLHPAHGNLLRRAAIDLEGVRTVLALRSEYGRPRKTLTDPARYYDPRYYDKALRP